MNIKQIHFFCNEHVINKWNPTKLFYIYWYNNSLRYLQYGHTMPARKTINTKCIMWTLKQVITQLPQFSSVLWSDQGDYFFSNLALSEGPEDTSNSGRRKSGPRMGRWQTEDEGNGCPCDTPSYSSDLNDSCQDIIITLQSWSRVSISRWMVAVPANVSKCSVFSILDWSKWCLASHLHFWRCEYTSDVLWEGYSWVKM